ncbi:MAG: TonB-dependent receptor, partial [Proteobacteria bacterium]|nr:TonB-dependent receptor [Pseudomonadota bacterium]
ARDTFSNQTDLTKKFEMGGIRHTALVGTEITQQQTNGLRQTAFFNNATTSVTVPASNPITLAPITFRQNATDANSHSEVRVHGMYVQDQLELNKYLQLIGGVRYDRFDISYRDNRTGTRLSREDGLVSPRAGIIVKPQEDVSLYTSYSVSFLPSAGDQFATLTAQSQGLRPEKLSNYEVGAKWDVLPNFNLSSAVYQLERENTRANDPNNPGQVVPTGSSRTRGVELGATGRITDAWQMIGGYAYQEAVITSVTAAARDGAKVALVPRQMASLWNKYDVTKEWAGALGVIRQSDQFANVDNAVRLKGFTRLDAALFYTLTPKHRLQLNVENVLNRRYSLTADGNNNIQPGSPLAFRLSLTSNF